MKRTKNGGQLRRAAAAPRAVLTVWALGALAAWATDARPAVEPIDWNRARELRQKSQQGSMLTPDEQAYLRRAVDERRRGGGRGQTTPGAVPRDRTGLVPLNEMTGDRQYQGQDGGLYGGGRNEPPPAHAQAALAEAARIVPVDANGRPARDGRIVLLSVGMSNTTQEFSRFQDLADRDPEKAPSVVIVDGAQGGQAAAQWAASPDSRVWQTAAARLKAAGVTPDQVQAVWLKQANIRPTEPFPAHTRKLEADIKTILHLLKEKFPNVRIAYLSSRIYAGYASTPLNPEPYAYESAFAVRELILNQIEGGADLNYDPAKGEVRSPLLLWGPYLWADGVTPRKSDGLMWKREDLREDGTHPSATSGRDKVAKLLLAFFKSDPTAKRWFERPPAAGTRS
ncbi:MAG: hypothetical protein A3G75_08575 [Verrucomicrobia bacterium RIFCSPLOWO2_12_FULL_64_8]|nr:MAG: hypothetical protein A3G75_08575 [Verrucomicrobia bacterium RIFCSPLOWO2_12_FULL_64_8]